MLRWKVRSKEQKQEKGGAMYGPKGAEDDRIPDDRITALDNSSVKYGNNLWIFLKGFLIA